jgi:hypothetical protein
MHWSKIGAPMIKGLISSVGRFSRDAAIYTVAIYVLVWAVRELNPADLLEKSEAKQVAYVDKLYSRIEGRLDRIEDKIDRLSPKGLAIVPKESNNNKN